MLDFKFSIDTLEVDKANKRLIRTTPALSREILGYLGEATVNRVVVHNATYPGPHSLKRRSGTYAKSINYKLANDFLARVGTNIKYGAIHEYGGTIKAKNAGSLHFMIGQKHIMVKEVHMPARAPIGTGLRYVWENEAQEIMDDRLDNWIAKEYTR